MNSICREIFRAIHEGKWLTIEYKNKQQSVTKYWIGILSLDVRRRSLRVDGLHLGNLGCTELNIYIDSILSAAIVEGSFQPRNEDLIQDIRDYPEKYESLFHSTANLKILNYLMDCSRLDSTPYTSKYTLIERLDLDQIPPDGYHLNDAQFRVLVNHFQYKTRNENANKRRFMQLAMNVMSVYTKEGLYVLAYRKLDLNVKARMLVPDQEITVCKEFCVDGSKKVSIRRFIDADDFYLLEDFEQNQERIKDCIMYAHDGKHKVDDIPYVIAIDRDMQVDLNTEYAAILDMFDRDEPTVPIQAFFGDVTAPSRNRKNYPITLLNLRVNLDQLLSIHNAMKYPLAYIQGPPGTGKTNTIINTIVTAFFNDKTVLFSSYNNHPIDGVFEELTRQYYRTRRIPFPILRLGNMEITSNALNYIRELMEQTETLTVYESTLDKNKAAKSEQTKRLSELLGRHEELLDLQERRDTIEKLMDSSGQLAFQAELQAKQLMQIDARISEIGEVTTEAALTLLDDDEESFQKYLFYTSARYIKRLNEPKYEELVSIIKMPDDEERVIAFNRWLSNGDNLKKLMRVFPVIATTCISAHRLGEPHPYFDMCIIDEASQCNLAMSLIPILRAEKLMLVGDPQQLSPVILLDAVDNQTLRKKYAVAKEYDYIENSIYKTFLACDSVSNEILLSCHYRCHPKIIAFNNQKYYHDRLQVLSQSSDPEPLVFCDVPNDTTTYKNTAPAEVECAVEYALQNPDKSIGIITPFANQRLCITQSLKENGITNVSCGTVHAFQGDEKDVILFSLALTNQTQKKTYDWLKDNKELINVAVSRAKQKLIIIGSRRDLERLHDTDEPDDIYELAEYVRTKGKSTITPQQVNSRALGIKPYSTETEEAFLTSLNHALWNVLNGGRCSVKREVPIAQVFQENVTHSQLFYSGRFDFVVYERNTNKQELPLLAIELDGKEHLEDEVVRRRDREKNEICQKHGFELIRVENSYARRYHYIKEILIEFFKHVR